MKITILGSGTSTGVPEVGCTCEVCRSDDPHDKRLRTSALVETHDTRILIDCGPDFREQVMNLPFQPIDGVLITHEHYDHVGGIDDLRPFCRLGEVTLYAEDYTAERLRRRIPYCFAEHKYPGVPQVKLQEIYPGRPFFIREVEVMPLADPAPVKSTFIPATWERRKVREIVKRMREGRYKTSGCVVVLRV